MNPAVPPRGISPHLLAALNAPPAAVLAVLAAIPWWQWETGPLRVLLAVCYGAYAVSALILAGRLKRDPAPASPREGVAR